MSTFNKFVSVQEAAKFIKDGDVVAINGVGWVANPELFYEALEDRYLHTGEPKGITLYSSCGIGGREVPLLANRLAHKGLVSELICGHLDSMRNFFPLINNNVIEAYNFPQGVLSLNLHNAARRSPGLMTKIGLNTSVDPRIEGGALNEVSKKKYVEAIEFRGDEYLFFNTIYPDICIIRGTTADKNGNITFEKEALQNDPLVTAHAVRNNGGKVIVQVERISDSHSNPQHVKIPGDLVDAIYLCPDQRQTYAESYNSLYSGEVFAPKYQVEAKMLQLLNNSNNNSVKRLVADRVVARRAALELRKGDFVNLGIGIPTMIGLELCSIGNLDIEDVTFTVETGIVGGIPAGEVAFGANINSNAIYSQASQFEFYEGGALDVTFVGALEIDKTGNVNVMKTGNKLFGIGGFNYVTQTPKRVVFCSKFMQGSGYKPKDDGFSIIDGRFCKFVDNVEHINYSSKNALEKGQKAIYITERGVFELSEEGLILIEISPYVDIEKDILSHLNFEVKISPNLKSMDEICFNFKEVSNE